MGGVAVLKKKPIQDLYNDSSNDAVNHSGQARHEFGKLEQDLNPLAWAILDLEKLAAAYQPTKVGAMSTFDPSEDTSDPREHLRRLKMRMRVVRENLTSLAHEIPQLLQRYEKLLAE
jgi:hypothetical protein